MNDKNSIIVISDDKNVAQELVSKIVLLRKYDEVVPVNYNSAISRIESLKPSAILICEHNSRDISLGLIEQIRVLNKDIALILLANEEDSEFILSAYDSGIDDFCLIDAESYELVIRIIKNLKSSSLRHINSRNVKLLAQNSIIDELTGIYNYKFSQDLYDSELTKNIEGSGIFVIFAPSEKDKKSFSMERFANVVKSSVRFDDIITLGKGSKIYAMFSKSDEYGALNIVEKVNKTYGIECEIKAGMTFYCGKENFKQIEKRALNALSEAMFSDRNYFLLKSEETNEKDDDSTDWDDLEETQNKKDFKLFKQAFYKKLDKVISPVFYRLQKIYEDKLPGVRINQYINENECIFHLKNSNQDSRLKIVYSGLSKVAIYIIHEGFDSPENTETIISLNKLTTDNLSEIVENFIKNFMITAV